MIPSFLGSGVPEYPASVDGGTTGSFGAWAIASSIACAASSHAAYVASGSDSRVRLTLSGAPPRNQGGIRRNCGVDCDYRHKTCCLSLTDVKGHVSAMGRQPRQVDHESLRNVFGKSAQYAGGDGLVRYVISGFRQLVDPALCFFRLPVDQANLTHSPILPAIFIFLRHAIMCRRACACLNVGSSVTISSTETQEWALWQYQVLLHSVIIAPCLTFPPSSSPW